MIVAIDDSVSQGVQDGGLPREDSQSDESDGYRGREGGGVKCVEQDQRQCVRIGGRHGEGCEVDYGQCACVSRSGVSNSEDGK